METQGKRIKEIREKLNINQVEFANIFKISRQFISDVEKDRKLLNNEKLCILLVDYNVNINYILAGIGSPFINTDMQDDFESRVLEILKERGL